jgi:hypothetical protein
MVSPLLDSRKRYTFSSVDAADKSEQRFGALDFESARRFLSNKNFLSMSNISQLSYNIGSLREGRRAVGKEQLGKFR